MADVTVPWFLLARIATATALGGMIGYERDRHGRPAGLRTHMVVALASATFMAVSIQFIAHQQYTDAERVNVDVSRIAAAIVTGIGFLGGGAILRNGLTVRGLTTAAGLWLVGAIGMAAGSGMYVVAVFSTGIGLLALGLLRRFEDKGADGVPHRLHVVLDAAAPAGDIEQRLRQLRVSFVMVALREDIAGSRREVELDLRFPPNFDPAGTIAALADSPGLRTIRLESQAAP